MRAGDGEYGNLGGTLPIVQWTPDDLLIEEARQLAGCSTKTLRRATQDGQLPKRYVMGPRGLQLVFGRQDLETWRSGRLRQRTAPPTSLQNGTEHVRMLDALGDLRQILETYQGRIKQLTSLLDQQDAALSRAQITITGLTNRVTDLTVTLDGAIPKAPAEVAG